VNRKTNAAIQLNDCVELTGGNSGDVGAAATGGAPDSVAGSNTYRVQTVTVVMDVEDADIHMMLVKSVDTSHETITLSNGRDAPPFTPDGRKGEDGTLVNADHPADWLHPFQVRAVIQYAKDLFLNGARDKSRALLSAYREALNPADEATGWPAALQLWRDELHELAAEVTPRSRSGRPDTRSVRYPARSRGCRPRASRDVYGRCGCCSPRNPTRSAPGRRRDWRNRDRR
jgi:hypothetical protein